VEDVDARSLSRAECQKYKSHGEKLGGEYDMDDIVRNVSADHELHDATPLQRANYLTEKLKDAEFMVAYAAESGIELEPKIRALVLRARVAETNGQWTVDIAEDLLSSVTILAMKLRPVTVESVKLCPNSVEADRLIRLYRKIVIILASLIVPFSFVTFVGGELTKTISLDLEPANKLAVIVGSADEVSVTSAQTPKQRTEAIRTLQEFAANTRLLYAHARQLDVLLAGAITDPYAGEKADANNRRDTLELPPDLTNLSGVATKRISVYQGIRYFAQTVQETVTIIYGAFGTCVLPVLYALLGSSAYLLREFEQQLRTRTLTQTDAHIAHFIVAAISGAVVGLFSNLGSGANGSMTPFNFGQGSLVSPLAMAFLVGYAVDVFFSFLEGMIQSFSRSRPAAAPAPATQTSLTPAR
jgi:hypothetical protein